MTEIIIILMLGVLAGIALAAIRCPTERTLDATIEKVKELVKKKETAQFYEPETPQERFNKAEKIDDLLKKL